MSKKSTKWERRHEILEELLSLLDDIDERFCEAGYSSLRIAYHIVGDDQWLVIALPGDDAGGAPTIKCFDVDEALALFDDCKISVVAGESQCLADAVECSELLFC